MKTKSKTNYKTEDIKYRALRAIPHESVRTFKKLIVGTPYDIMSIERAYRRIQIEVEKFCNKEIGI